MRVRRPDRRAAAGHRPAAGAGRARRGCRWRGCRAPVTRRCRPPPPARSARPAGRGPIRSTVPAGTRERASGRRRAGRAAWTGTSAPVTATVAARVNRSVQPVRVISRPAACSGLPTRRLASRRAAGSRAPDAGHAQVRPAGPAQVLHGGERTGAEHLDGGRAGHAAHQPDPGARAEPGRRVGGHVEQHQVGPADQQPAAGRRGRVDAGVRAGQRDRAGRHPGRGVASRGSANSAGSPVR